MKNNLRVISLVMIASTIFSGSLLFYNINDVIVPSWSDKGVYLYVYVLTVVVFIAAILKLITGINGLTAFSKGITEEEKQKRLTISGKLAVPVVASGILYLALKIFYGDTFLVADVFEIALNILLGLMFIVCSMYVRAGRE